MSFLSRENQHFFLNTTKLRGIRNVDISSSFGGESLRYIGVSGENPYIPVSTPVNNISINSSFVATDPFIFYTGTAFFNSYIVEDINQPLLNVSINTGYLTSYQLNCSVGSIPELSITADVYGAIGRFDANELESAYASIPFELTDDLQVITPNGITATFDDLIPTALRSFNLKINVQRKPIYALGYKNPVEVKRVLPVEVTLDFRISSKNYTPFKTNRFSYQPRTSNVILSLKDKNNTEVAGYTFNNMTLVSENPGISTENDAETLLTYKSVIY